MYLCRFPLELAGFLCDILPGYLNYVLCGPKYHKLLEGNLSFSSLDLNIRLWNAIGKLFSQAFSDQLPEAALNSLFIWVFLIYLLICLQHKSNISYIVFAFRLKQHVCVSQVKYYMMKYKTGCVTEMPVNLFFPDLCVQEYNALLLK